MKAMKALLPPVVSAASNQIVLFFHLLLLWTICNYLVKGDSVIDSEKTTEFKRRYVVEWKWVIGRSIAMCFVVWLMSNQFLLGIALAILGTLLPLVRAWPEELRKNTRVPKKHRISGATHWIARSVFEWEVVFNLAAVYCMWVAVQNWGGRFRFILINTHAKYNDIPGNNYVCVTLGILSASIMLGKFSTYVVRGILEKAGTTPIGLQSDKDNSSDKSGKESTVKPPEPAHTPANGEPPNSQQPSGERKATVTYQHGAIIGVLERIVIAFVIVNGTYEALGYLYAAKGLIRSKDLEQREFAEYFLVGTLASTVLALIIGLLLQYLLWEMGLPISKSPA